MTGLATIRTRVTAIQAVVIAIGTALLVLAAVFAWQSNSLRDDPALSNRAQLDKVGQEAVITVVSRGLTQVLSYDYNEPDATRAFADQILSGQARKEYDTLFASLQERAPGQKLTLTAEVRVAGMKELSPTKASMLIFVDQKSTRIKDKEASVSAAQLSVTAERKGKAWVITGLKPL